MTDESDFKRPTQPVTSTVDASSTNAYNFTIRTEETGTIPLDLHLSVDIIFEHAPVWLLGLDRHLLRSLYVVGFSSMTEILTHLSKLNLDVAFYNQAFVSLGIGRISTGMIPRENSDITLVSGSLRFLNEQAVTLRKKKCILITANHYNLRKLPPISETF